MPSIKYEPINTSCVNMYNNNNNIDVNNEVNAKQKIKVLAYMNQGQGTYDNYNNFDTINSCVMPNEALSIMDLDSTNCYLRNNNDIVNTNFKKSIGGSLDPDINISNNQIKKGSGVYPDQGCSIATDDSSIFKQAIEDSANAIDFENNKISLVLKKQLQSLKDKNITLNNSIIDQQNILASSITNYNTTLVDCNNNVTLKKTLLNQISQINNAITNNTQKQNDINNSWNTLNNTGRSLVKQCNNVKNNSVYPIMNRKQNNKCIDVYQFNMNNMAPITTWDCWGGPNQKWKMDDQSHIVSDFSGKCLEVGFGKTDDGSLVNQATCHGGINQNWNQDNQNRLHLQHAPDMCLDAGNANNGTQLSIKRCNNDNSQQFDGIQSLYNTKYHFRMKNINDNSVMYPNDNGTVNGHTYCAGGWGSVQPGEIDDDGNWITPRLDGQNKNMKCLDGTTYSDPRGASYMGARINCDDTMIYKAGGLGNWGYRCM